MLPVLLVGLATGCGSDGGDSAAPSALGPDATGPDAPPASEAFTPFNADPTDLLGQRAVQLLANHCEGCHGAATQSTTSWVLDVGQLIARGWIVPGSSATSRVLPIVTDNHGATPRVRTTQPSVGDVELFARFIDALGAETPTCAPLPFVGSDAALASMALDLSALPPPARPFARYLGLTYASNAGVCGAALERQRQALFQAVNSVSTGEAIALPRAIDDSELIYRIDIRDYAWNRAIDLEDDGSVDFADGWLAAADAAGPYAVEYDGPQAESIKAETGAPAPFLPAHAFVNAVAAGNLYYALTGAPGSAETQRTELGIPYLEPNQGLAWVGFFGSGPARDVIAVRAQQTRANRAYWLIEDMNPFASESVFSDPFGFDYNPHQILYALPNGLFAYAIEQPDTTRGARVTNHALCSECGEVEVTLAGCSSCHGSGLLPLADAVRDATLRDAQAFDRQTLELVQTEYPTADELGALVEADNAIHRAALEQLGITANAPDPLSRVYFQFELDALTPSAAAAELGVPLAALEAALANLGPELAPLRDGGSVSRAAFTAAYAAALCVLQENAGNRPAQCP